MDNANLCPNSESPSPVDATLPAAHHLPGLPLSRDSVDLDAQAVVLSGQMTRKAPDFAENERDHRKIVNQPSAGKNFIIAQLVPRPAKPEDLTISDHQIAVPLTSSRLCYLM
ncbi:unnamed protein product [Protopolystoma xenopodis]|uniref:Uncharacterized protein n=1 Tax=Protopolystoma xenopodis TaxID=117903 RepID=A0A448WLN3_9PLAT|nr:unnamed protein product [Protopolystoma xenopodis]